MTTNYKPLMMKYILLMNEYDRKRIIYIDLFVLYGINILSIIINLNHRMNITLI